MREVRWEQMFVDELEAAFAACPVVYLPQGLCEPHGPQNTVGLDALKAHAICVAAARAHGGIVAPADYWHVHETGAYAAWARDNIGEVRPWMTALPAWHHFKNVVYQLRAFDALGFRAAIILTGHYGPNWGDLKTTLSLLQPFMAMRMHGCPDFEANTRGFTGDGKATGDHAGQVETSLLWAVEPECVDFSRIPPLNQPGPHFAMGDSARNANRLTGERMVRDEVEYLGRKAKELLAAYDQDAPKDPKPLSFADVERIWRDVIKPQLPKFHSMQNIPADKIPPADSRWRLNCPIPDGMG